MPQPVTLKSVFNTFLPKAFLTSLLLGALFFPQDVWAHDGNLLKDEITALEKLFTGRIYAIRLLGRLWVCRYLWNCQAKWLDFCFRHFGMYLCLLHEGLDYKTFTMIA